MRKTLIALLGALAVMSVLAGTASAHTSRVLRAHLTVAQFQAVNAVQGWESSMPQATSASQVYAQAAAVQPAVDRILAQATATGNGAAVQALIDQTSLPGSVAVHEAILRDSTASQDTTSGVGPVGPPGPVPSLQSSVRHGHAAGCWGADGSVWHKNGWGGAIWTIGWIDIISNGWCGNGSSITYFPGFHFSDYQGPGYCIENKNEDSGSWISFWGWAHGQINAEVGPNSYLLGCLPPFPGSRKAASMREAANGYRDWNY